MRQTASTSDVPRTLRSRWGELQRWGESCAVSGCISIVRHGYMTQVTQAQVVLASQARLPPNLLLFETNPIEPLLLPGSCSERVMSNYYTWLQTHPPPPGLKRRRPSTLVSRVAPIDGTLTAPVNCASTAWPWLTHNRRSTWLNAHPSFFFIDLRSRVHIQHFSLEFHISHFIFQAWSSTWI